jgi:hypothetical protein
MFSDLDQRLLQAAEQEARYRRLERRISEMGAEQREAGETVRRLQAQLADEEHDVERLEGVSLTGLFYSILGSKEAQLEKERHAVLAAQLKYTEAERRHASLAQELELARRELAALAGAPAQYAALLKQKESAMSGAAGDGARQLAQFGEREQQLYFQVQQLQEAQVAGQRADAALATVAAALNSAEGWGTWDMLGGGLIATAVKHSHIDDARAAAHGAQGALTAFQRELKDVSAEVHVDSVAIDGFDKFADYFFDGLIADWVVQNRINDSLQSVRNSRSEVAGLMHSLDRRLAKAASALEALREERASFIAQYQG